MTNAELFIALQHRLRDYDQAMLACILLALSADQAAVKTTARSLAETHLGGLLTAKQVQRATARLVELGLVEVRVHPKTWTEFRIRADQVLALLETPLPEARYLPGVSSHPIHFLNRVSPETSSATAPLSLPQPTPEDVA